MKEGCIQKGMSWCLVQCKTVPVADAQVREKEDRHQQQKISGFLQPLEDIQAAREAAAAADMEVCTGQR